MFDAVGAIYEGSHISGQFLQLLNLNTFDVQWTLLGGVGNGQYTISGYMPEDLENLIADNRFDLYCYRDLLNSTYTAGVSSVIVRDGTRFNTLDTICMYDGTNWSGPMIVNAITGNTLTTTTSATGNFVTGDSVLVLRHRGVLSAVDTNDSLNRVQSFNTIGYGVSQLNAILVNENVQSSGNPTGTNYECGWVLYQTLASYSASGFFPDLIIEPGNFLMSSDPNGSPWATITSSTFTTAQWAAISSSVHVSLQHITGTGSTNGQIQTLFNTAINLYPGTEPNGKLFTDASLSALSAAYLTAMGQTSGFYEHGPSAAPFFNAWYARLQTAFGTTTSINNNSLMGTGVAYSGTNASTPIMSFIQDIITTANGGNINGYQYTLDVDVNNVVHFHQINDTIPDVFLFLNKYTDDGLGDGLFGDCVIDNTTHGNDLNNIINTVNAVGGNDALGNPITCTVNDLQSTILYGQRESLQTNSNMNDVTSLQQWAVGYLNQHAYPITTFNLTVYPTRTWIDCTNYVQVGFDPTQPDL